MPSTGNIAGQQHSWPQNVGILGIEIYFPSTFVDQSELEQFDGVSAGKYTIGLGQTRMGFCTDREDIQSICLTVVQRLLEKCNVQPEEIGRLEVGTETIIDKSKSVKSTLMQLFGNNSTIEGIDTTNACYGGTAAFFNALNWVESSCWDGRYALVVAGDIAVYAKGNARPTGGAGAVAMLVGPNAPLVVERGMRGTHMEHAYDFYKPNLNSEYPVVDGKLSIQCYLNALDQCYRVYRQKSDAQAQKEGRQERFTLDNADGCVFHSPFCKLVQKSLARLLFNDFLSDPNPDYAGRYAGLEQFRERKLVDTFFDRDVEVAFLAASKKLFEQKTKESLLLATQVGNMYTPSVYGGLVSFLISKSLADLAGRRVVLFSYGSGMAASMYSLHISQDVSENSPLRRLYENLSDVRTRLESRIKVPPQLFDATMHLREETHHLSPYLCVGPVESLFPGTYYLVSVDDMHRRIYERKSLASPLCGDAMTEFVKKTVPSHQHVENVANGN